MMPERSPFLAESMLHIMRGLFWPLIASASLLEARSCRMPRDGSVLEPDSPRLDDVWADEYD